MADEQFPHIVVRKVSRGEKFARPGTGGARRLPSRVPDRQAHAARLLQQLHDSQDATREALARRSNVLTQAQNGIYLAIESRAAEPLRLRTARPCRREGSRDFGTNRPQCG